MKVWQQRWKDITARYAALTRRERLLVAAGLVLGPLLIGNALYLEPAAKRAKLLESGIARQEASITELQAQILVVGQQLHSDPDAAKKAELAALQKARDNLDKDIATLGSSLVNPADMNELLSHLLAKQSGLRLVSLKTLLPSSVLGGLIGGDGKDVAKDGAKDGAGKKLLARAFDLYRHGVEIRLEGSYGELMAYVAQLERHKSRLLLEQLHYRVVEHPKAEMTLIVYTLSPDRAWLSL